MSGVSKRKPSAKIAPRKTRGFTRKSTDVVPLTDVQKMPFDNSRIQSGASFKSYAEFETVFEAWRVEHGHPLRIASSEMLKKDDKAADKFKYKYVVYHCMHYGTPRLRGSGKRLNQAYLPCGCKASLRLSYHPVERELRICKLEAEHTGHDIASYEGNSDTGRYFVSLKQFMPYGSRPNSRNSGLLADSHGVRTKFDIRVQEQYVEQLKELQKKNYNLLAERRTAEGLPLLSFDPPPLAMDSIGFFKKLSDTELMTLDQYKEMAGVSQKMIKKKLTLLELAQESRPAPPPAPIVAPQMLTLPQVPQLPSLPPLSLPLSSTLPMTSTVTSLLPTSTSTLSVLPPILPSPLITSLPPAISPDLLQAYSALLNANASTIGSYSLPGVSLPLAV